MSKAPSKSANKRGAARLAVVQALYQMEITGIGLLEVVAEYEELRLGQEIDGDKYIEADADWFRTTLGGVIELQKTIDPVIHASLPESWPLRRLEIILRAIMRAGVYELVKRKDVPAVVVITEYVDIAKAFFEGDEWRMVNGLLDGVARKTSANDKTLKVLEEAPDSLLDTTPEVET